MCDTVPSKTGSLRSPAGLGAVTPGWNIAEEVLSTLFVLQQALGAADLETKPRRCSASRRNSEWETMDGSRSGAGGGRALQQRLNQGRGCTHGMGNQRTGISQRRSRRRRKTSSCQAEQRQRGIWGSRQRGAEFAGGTF